MDTYLKDYLKLSAYGAFIGEILFPSAGGEKPVKKENKVSSFPLRGFGRFRPTYKVVNETTDLDILRLSNPGPIRGLGRVGSFYKTLALKQKNEIFTISEKKFNYWRGAGKKREQTQRREAAKL